MLCMAVTLLGAHSLGHMHIDVSGYGFVDDRVLPEALNAWDDTPAVLDNDYYVQLLKQVRWTDTSLLFSCLTYISPSLRVCIYRNGSPTPPRLGLISASGATTPTRSSWSTPTSLSLIR